MRILLSLVLTLVASMSFGQAYPSSSGAFPPEDEGGGGLRQLWDDFTGTAGGSMFGPVAINGGTFAQDATGDVDHPGVATLTSGASADSGVFWTTGAQAFLIDEYETFWVIFRVDSSTDNVIHMGYHDSVTAAAPVDGVFFNVAGLNLTGKASSNSSVTTTTSTYVVTADTWYQGKITVNSGGSSASFNIYSELGSLLWNDAVSSNLPTGAGRVCGAGVTAYKTSTTGADLVSLDYMEATIPIMAARAGMAGPVSIGAVGGGGDGTWGSITGTLSDQTDLSNELNTKADIPSSNGFMARTAPSTINVRTFASSDGSVTVTNGDGQSGNPDVVVDDSVFARYTQGTAGAPGTCAVGTFHVETDDTELYYCDSTDSQTLVGASVASISPTVAMFMEEFGTGTGTDTHIGSLGWRLVNVAGTVTASNYNAGPSSDILWTNLGVTSLATSTSSGDGGSMSLGTQSSAYELLGRALANGGWDSYFVFALDSAASVDIRIGLTPNPANTDPAGGVWLRFDSAADTNFMLCGGGTPDVCWDTSTAADTSFHTIRIRSVVSGTILMSLDGGTERSFCASGCDETVTHVEDGMIPAFVISTNTTAAKTVYADYFAFQATGLSR